ncbi:hypothetical protein [Aquamicrobium sp. LC103]|uniref:hypothetical protein n=1 Tax=Aquamicrobium sp. LC103 TaxID=1120658 RepID=UPI00063E7DFE|nr:hypothetical protein [Aquamicrobium sp. LC103]TKT81239.1 hypothetical protein XW59_005055 [Aquamicrobium sp. LC103]
MKQVLKFARLLVALGAAVSSVSTPASALPLVSPNAPGNVVYVADDCYAIGMQQARQVGGQLAKATPETRGGRTVCVIVVLVPGRDGERPRRNEIVVPLN